MKKRPIFLSLIPLMLPALSDAKQSFPVMQAKTYAHQAISGWLASEKLDGVRGYWTGEKMRSRNGYDFIAPTEFISGFPEFALDGELYIDRGQFAKTSGIVRKAENWDEITYYVFDVPNAKGGLLERLAVLRNWLKKYPTPNIAIVEQVPVTDIIEAQKMRAKIEKKGGEGVMLRNPSATYIGTRTETMLKLKSTQDAECEVQGYTAGKGKYMGKVGALKCQLPDGRVIKIGSGLSDADRTNPPPIGSVITFRYNGLTKTGKPRFARFWRIRN